MPLNLFGSRPSDPALVARLKQWTAEVFGLRSDVSILVTELRCNEEGCPDVETVIAVFTAPGQPLPLKIFKPMQEITRADVAGLISSLPLNHSRGDASHDNRND